jgi:hypothetical protein
MVIYTENDGVIKTKLNQGALLKWGHFNKRRGIFNKGRSGQGSFYESETFC